MTDPERPAPLIAGRYRLGSRLGRGGMAEVFDAFDERLERPVALKVLRKEVAAEAQMRQRFEAEARAAARLSHPAVVSVYDSGEHGGRAFLVMERLPGETLADRIKRGPVDQVWLKQAAADVLSALAAAHGMGLIHRDIKPGNILITEDNRVKVADFGIAKSVVGTNDGGEDLTQVGMVLGTPAYLAPERLAGEAATVGTDLYALGVVLFEAATGHKPPAGAADATVVGTGAAGAGALAPAAGDPPLDPALARVIRRSMAPNPADRYTSADAMAADLGGPDVSGAVPATVALPQTALAPAATQVMTQRRPPIAGEEVAEVEPGRRRGLAIAAGLIALLILVIILVLLLTHHSSPSTPDTTTVPPTAPPSTAPSTTIPTTTTTVPTTTTTVPTTTTTVPTTTTTVPTTTTTRPTTTTTTTTAPAVSTPSVPAP